ncbi:MAG: taurine catabolism dioxygenase TauD [Thiotrichales bacterium]|nr:taurine catabolism dioxygenase TauD [Thiotrichales bacterium]|tara:strand:- start:746 stop:1591 length:846 start_codon:yes stop_codon:yes gene_type:complete
MSLEILPSGGALGAEIRGVDLSKPLGNDTGQAIVSAFHQHQVIFFKGQSLTDTALLEFSSLFGKPLADHRPKDYHPELATDVPDLVDVVSNIVEDGKPIGALGNSEAIWHSDTVPLPNSACALYALELPEVSPPTTRFASALAAFEAMPEELRTRLEGRIIIHGRQDYSLEKGDFDAEIDPSLSPGPWFPLVREHVATGRRGVFLGRQGDCYIVDLSVEESNELLEEIWSRVTHPDFVYEHHWSVGDVLVWDNRCTLHSRGKIVAGRRRLHRTTMSGEWPR